MNKKFLIFLPLIIALSVVAGIVIGNGLRNNSMAIPGFATSKSSNKINAILDLVVNGYVDSINTADLVEKTIPDMLKNLDPHTTYIPARNMQEVDEEMHGQFSGIGVQFSIQEDTVRVIEVISGGPSQKVGILPGDRIIRVNDSTIAGNHIVNNTVLKLLRGSKGSKVKVDILRKGFSDFFEFEITRGEIPIYSVDVSYMIDKETGFIKVSRFAEKTYDEFTDGMDKLKKEGASKIIVDLRGNPGGYLPLVLRMVDDFLKKDEPILYTQGLHQPKKVYNATASDKYVDFKVFVLIDEFSASASEIFAGALQDNDRAIVIGRRSFGKGLVQDQIPFPDGSALRLTVARFYTPSGRCIQKPYLKGTDEYYQEMYDRMQNHEFEVADSIRFNDSLKYYTKGGRVVYGGGGIMPDIFVPVDTVGYSEYFSRLVQKGIIYQFAYKFADENRDALSKLKNADAISAYLDSKNVLNLLVNYAVAKGIARDAAGLKKSEVVLNVQVKANIARNILGEEGFYPIIRQIDLTVQKAVEASKQGLLVTNLKSKN